MPRLTSATGPGISVTITDDCRSVRSNPGKRLDGTKPGGGAIATDVPVTRIACAKTGDTCNSITTIGVMNLILLLVSGSKPAMRNVTLLAAAFLTTGLLTPLPQPAGENAAAPLGTPGPNIPKGKAPQQGYVPAGWHPHMGSLLKYSVQIRFGEEPETMPEGMRFGRVSAVTTDAQNDVYVFKRDPKTDQILVFDSQGKYQRSWGKGMFGRPQGLRTDREGNIWATDGSDAARFCSREAMFHSCQAAPLRHSPGCAVAMKVLIVEENSQMQELLTSLVASVSGETASCNDGDEALAEYAAPRPDWVLMDLQMARVGPRHGPGLPPRWTISATTSSVQGNGRELNPRAPILNLEFGGRMRVSGVWTGGVAVIWTFRRSQRGERVTHGFEIHCDLREPNNIEVNWPGGNNFHLTELTGALCTDSPAIDQKPPQAPFDTFIGTGTGKLNNKDGAKIEFVFVDGGEPGVKDTVSIKVFDEFGNLVLDVSGPLDKGNQQAHKDNK